MKLLIVAMWPLVIRYFEKECFSVQEVFVGFVACIEEISGEAIAKVILETVNNLGLDICIIIMSAIMLDTFILDNI